MSVIAPYPFAGATVTRWVQAEFPVTVITAVSADAAPFPARVPSATKIKVPSTLAWVSVTASNAV